jgi:hypothetical protein
MILDRLVSLLLSTALVACPSVCRAGACSECPDEPTQTVACPHCQAGRDSAPLSKEHSEAPSPEPSAPKDHCELGNCLCAGAVTNGGGLDLQIGHELGVFGAIAPLGHHTEPTILSTLDAGVAVDRDDPQTSGRRLRLRIESLLI